MRPRNPHRPLASLVLALLLAGPAAAEPRPEAPAPRLPGLESDSLRPVPTPDFGPMLRRSLQRRGLLEPRTPAPPPYARPARDLPRSGYAPVAAPAPPRDIGS